MSDSRSATLLTVSYLSALAAPEPTPGGGSASAVAAAIGVSLLEMVASLSEQSAQAETQPLLASLPGEFREIRERLTALGAEDEHAYGGFRDALALPKATPDEKAHRREVLQQATVASANAPLAIAEAALLALDLIPQLAAIASPYLRSDLATAAHLLAGAAHGAIVMVDTNLGSIKDEAIRGALTSRRNHVANRVSAARDVALHESQ
jgi:formiminotetrahydrofolate cyclodeaminase